MKRSASLDLLRGGAAFAVAIPHYLTANAPFQPFAEAFAIAGVEVFFVLSGFVLAPQIVDWVVGQAVAQSRRVSRPALDAHHPALRRRADRHCGPDRQPDDRRLCALSLLCREPLFLRQPRRLLSRSLEPRGRGMVLCSVCSRSVRCRKAPWATRPAARGDLRGPGHSHRGGAAVLDLAARLGLERPAGHALPHRLDRLGLSALSCARASPASGAERRLRPMAPGCAPRAACGLDPGRARRRDLGHWRRRVGPAGVSLRLGGVRHDLSWRALAGRRPFPQSRRQRRKPLPRPYLVLGLPLPSHHHHGAEADDRRDAARPATGDLCARDPCAVDRLLCRIRTADPGGATLLRRGASCRRGDRRATRRSSRLAFLASHRCACDLRRSPPARSPATPSWPPSPMRSIRSWLRRRFSRLRSRGERGPSRPARSLWRRAPSFCSRSRCRSPTLSIAARPDCRWSRRSLRRPIPIAPRTPIRLRSRPGGSIISTNGSGTTE